MAMDFNIWAVLVSAVASFFVGGFWYSPALFGRLWQRESKNPKQDGHQAKVFVISFIFALIAATAFAFVLGSNPPLSKSLQLGLICGACFVAASFGHNYQFANRSMIMWLIDGGYHTVQFIIYGLIIGLWH
jgi:hypothetical protein